MQLKVAAVIPAFNEEKSIGRVVVLSQKNADYVIVVDDGSKDMTGDIAEKLGAITLKLSSNQGKGAALRKGVEYATQNLDFDILVTLDSDLQHDPKEIPFVTRPIIDGIADIVIGVRPMNSDVMPRERIVGNKIFDRMSNMGEGQKYQDTQSGFRAYSKTALEHVKFVENGLAVESQTFIDAKAAGMRMTEVPISTTYVGIKSKRNPLTHFSQVLDYILTRTVADSPLLYLGLPGIVGIVVGVVAGLRVVQIFINNHQQIAAGTALVAVTAIIIGAVLIATSLIIKLLRIQALSQ